MIDQITVFLENTEGRLAKLTRAISDAGVNMKALTIAESTDYGLVRIIVDDTDRCLEALAAADFRANRTEVSAIEVPNRPGGLADLLQILDDMDLNVEYGYCFSATDQKAVDVFKIQGDAAASRATFRIEEAGFKVLQQGDI
ncbi:MAG: hypothetical protein ACI4B6_02270 [Atopobiaceae bacterium]